MKNKIYYMLFSLLFFFSTNVFSQCAMCKVAVESLEGTELSGLKPDEKLLKFIEESYNVEEWRALIDQMNKLKSFSRKNVKWRKNMKDCSNFNELEKKLNKLNELMGIESLDNLLF